MSRSAAPATTSLPRFGRGGQLTLPQKGRESVSVRIVCR